MVCSAARVLFPLLVFGVLGAGGAACGQVPPMVSSQPVVSKPPATQPVAQPATAPTTQATRPAQRVITCGFVRADAANPWDVAVANSVQAEAEKRGVTLKTSVACATQAEQIAALRAWLGQKPDALVLIPLVETGWDEVLREVKQMRIPLFVAGRNIRTSAAGAVKTVVTSDFLEQGRMVARYLAAKTGGVCRFAELQGPADAVPTVDRTRALGYIMEEELTNLVRVRIESTDGTRAKGRELMAGFLKAEREALQAVFAHSDELALGAAEAVDAAGLKPGRGVLIISTEGARAALEAVRQGRLSASIECNVDLGPLVFDALITTVRGGKVPHRILVKDELFDETVTPERIAARPY